MIFSPWLRSLNRNRYLTDGLLNQLAPVHNKPLRTIPINLTVEDPRRILPYEDVMGIVESQDFLAVSRCACRQRKRLDPDSAECRHPEEVCLHFKGLARYLVDNGLGRRIAQQDHGSKAGESTCLKFKKIEVYMVVRRFGQVAAR